MKPRFWLLLLLYAVLAVAYSLLVPPWEAPDETAHYLVVEHVARSGEMPPFEQSYETVQPPGYYWLAGALFRATESVDPQLTRRLRPPLTPESEYTRYGWTGQNYGFLWGMQILRWFNVTIGALALFFIYRGAKGLLDAAGAGPSALAVAGVVALTPQFLHNTAAVSNDALANACGALFFWLLVDIALRPPSGRRLALAAAAAIVLPFLVKLTLLPMSAALLLTLAWRAGRVHRRLLLFVALVAPAVLAAGLALAAPATARFLLRTLWWRLTFIRPDIFDGWSLSQILSYYAAGYWGQIGWKFAALPCGLWGALWASAWLGSLFSLRLLCKSCPRRRFWRWVFAIAAALTALALLAQQLGQWWRLSLLLPATAWLILLFAWWRMQTRDPAQRLALPAAAWRAVWLAAGLAFIVVARNALTTPQFQARFLFPALGPITTIAVVGWWTVLSPRLQQRLTAALVAVFVALNLFFWVDTVIPRFFQPFLDG